MHKIFESWPNTIRFLVTFVCSLLILILIIHFLTNNQKLLISFKDSNALVTIKDNRNLFVNSVLPGCDCWVNTGIEIRPEEEINLKISGKIHAASDKLMEFAQKDEYTSIPWIGPEGDDFRFREPQFRYYDSLRISNLLDPSANFGQVLLYLVKDDAPIPNCKLGSHLFLPNPIDVRPYEKSGFHYINNSESTFYIYAAVNDILIRDFSELSKKMFLGGYMKEKKRKEKLESWKNLSKNNYNAHWFDDNIGAFILSAKIEKNYSPF